MKKSLRMLAFSLMFCLALTGCTPSAPPSAPSGSSKEADTSAPAANGEKATLQLWYWEGAMEQAWNENLIANFEKQNPNINIELTIMPWANYWQKVQTSAVSNTLPDLMIMSVGFIEQYAKAGKVINLKSYIDRDLDRSQYYDSALRTTRYPSMESGDEFGMPWNIVENCLYYNKDMFDAAKIPYPDDTWTWDMLRETAKKLTKDTGDMATAQYGFSCTPSAAEFFESLIYSYGGRVVSEDLTKCMLDQPESEAAMQMITSMMLTDKTMPAISAQGEATGADFASGRVAMEVNGCWMFENMQTATSVNWDIAPMPKGPAGRAPRSWSDSICITSDSKFPEEGWAFINFLVGEQGQTTANLSSTRIPVYIPNSLSDEFLQPGTAPEHKKILVDSLSESDPFVFRGNWGEWSSVLANEIFPAFTGEKSVKEALASTTQAINLVLDVYNADK